MNARALAPLGALGLGVLAVVLLALGNDPPAPAAHLPTSGSDATAGAAVSGTRVRAENEPRPRSAQSPSAQEGTAPTLEGVHNRPPEGVEIAEWIKKRRSARMPSATTLAQLAQRRTWIKFLETWHFLRSEKDLAKRFTRIESVFAGAENPILRQNLIFLAALAFPPEVSGPWLETLTTGANPGDAADALCALAFSGEPKAHAQFVQLAAAADSAKVHRLVYIDDHEALGNQGTEEARDILRSYRSIEASDRSPYFHLTAFEASHNWSHESGYGERLGWVAGYPRTPERTIELYLAFLQRYPGHPVSDDLARRMGSYYARSGDLVEGVRWYSRASTLPDQDKAYSAATLMASYAEIILTPEQVLRLSEDQGLDTPNRAYFQYVWLRRLASGRGFEVATRAWETLAAREPASELGVAWQRRFSAKVPKGLDSGLDRLAANDVLRLLLPTSPPWPVSESPALKFQRGAGLTTGYSWPEEKWRLSPWPEPVVLHRGRLVKQARAWVTLAELERRTLSARGAARADLLYKQAAIFYHDRDVLFPAYGYHTMNFSGTLRGATWGFSDEEGNLRRKALLRFEEASFSYLRSVALFRQIEREHPDYQALDKVVFSQGMAWRLLTDYRPYYAWSPALKKRWEGRQDPSIRSIVEAFERCVERFPESTLSDDAAAAASYWRRIRKDLFAGD